MDAMKKWNRIFLVVMLTVPIIHWVIFWLFLNFQSIMMAFQFPNGSWTLSNFKTLWLTVNAPKSEILMAVKNTFMWFGLNNFIIFPFTIMLNYFFFKKIPGYKAFRILLYIPGLLSGVATSAMIQQLVGANGPLGIILKGFGMKDVPAFFQDSDWSNTSMIIYTLWHSWGASMLLLGGTYARVPQEVLESAMIDGCGPFRELVQIVIPMISNTLVTMIILNCTGIFGASGPIHLFTPGEQASTYGTLTLAYWIFDTVISGSGNYNTVACTGLVFTAIAVPVILTIRWLLEKIPVVEY